MSATVNDLNAFTGTKSFSDYKLFDEFIAAISALSFIELGLSINFTFLS
jgi:hypothetical protein